MKFFSVFIPLTVLLGHFFYVIGSVGGRDQGSGWADLESLRPAESRWELYTASGEYWLGLSYALAALFAAWCLIRVFELRREAAVSSAGGLTLSGVLVASVCFFTGCCGSPMLPVYLGLFGPQFMSVTKPLTFGITLVSIAVGYAWMVRTAPKRIGNR